MKTKLKNLTLALIIFGWFFAMRAPDSEVEGVFSTMMTGPYVSEMQCRHYQERTEDVLKQIVPGIQFKKCFYLEEV